MMENAELNGLISGWIAFLAVFAGGMIALSALMTRGCIALLPKLGMVDKATRGGRKIHKCDMPRGGGLAIVITWFVGGVVLSAAKYCFDFIPCDSFVPLHFLRMSLPLLVLVVVGILDDRLGLKSYEKLLGQLIVAVMAWLLGFRMECIATGGAWILLNIAVTVFWYVIFINAYNLIDGLDGLAAGLAIISSVCIAFVALCSHITYGLCCSILLGSACVGFLVYNFPPAKIFLGDTGSMALGYLLATYGINLERELEVASALVVPLMVCGVPLMDVIFAVWRRVTRKLLNPKDTNVGIMTADKLHLHHRVLEYFHSNQFKTVIYLYVLAALLAVVAIMCSFLPFKYGFLGVLVFLTTFSVVVMHYASIELWNSSRLIFDNWGHRRPGIMVFIFQPLFDVMILVLAARVAQDGCVNGWVRIVQIIFPVCIVLLCSRNYLVIWKYGSAVEYFRLMVVLASGFLVSFVWNLFAEPEIARFKLFFESFCYTVVFCLGQRLFLHYLRMWLIKNLNNSKYLGLDVHRTMLYGVSEMGHLYLNHCLEHFAYAPCEKILGFITDDPVFRHTYCYDLPVFGHLHELEFVFEKHPFSKLVICVPKVSPENFDVLKDFCLKHGILLMRCYNRMQVLAALKDRDKFTSV